MNSRGRFPGLLALAFLLAGAAVARAVEAEKFTDSFKRDYFLFTPDKIDPAETYWLVVDVHAVGGHGSATSGVRDWVKRERCIGVSPSFPDGYQSLGLDTDQQLLAIFKKLRKDFKLHDKLFIYGHSAGAQFAHRFALKYPQSVVGCCATSAGSWATAGYGDISPAAGSMPLAISCGELDTGRAWPAAPSTRIEWARLFEQDLKKKRLFYKARYWPDAGHGGDGAGNARLARESFALGTSGLVGADREAFDARLAELAALPEAGKPAQALASCRDLLVLSRQRDVRQTAKNLEAAGWSAGSAGIDACTKTAQTFMIEETQRLIGKIEQTGLDQIASIEAGAAGDALAKLREINDAFVGSPSVQAAAAQAAARIKNRPL